MKNMVIASIVAVAVTCAIGICFVTKGTRDFSFASPSVGQDLIIVNDTSETASSAFKRDGKMMSTVMHSGEKTSGGRGVMRIFIAKKNGVYEIEYSFPRPEGTIIELPLSKIFESVHSPELDEELYIERGKIGDITIEYEEVRDLDATY